MTRRSDLRRPAAGALLAAGLALALAPLGPPGAVAAVPTRAAALATGPAATPTRAVLAAGTLPVGSRVLAGGDSGIQPTVVVLGSDGSRVLWETVGLEPDDGGQPTPAAEGLFTVPAAGGAVRTFTGVEIDSPVGTTAGTTYLSTGIQGDPTYLDFASGAHGYLGPVEDAVAYPGGAVQVGERSAGDLTLYVERIDGSFVTLGSIPDITGGAGIRLLADTHGVLAAQGRTLDWLATGADTARRLDTAGITSAAFRCTSVTAAAVGCTDGTTVYRIPTDGSAPLAVRSAGVVSVVVTPTTTAWIAGPGHRLSTRVGTTASSTTTTTTYAVESAVAVGDDIAFSRDGAAVGGVYRTAAAGAAATRLARAPVRALTAQTVTVGAGRVTWVDDGTAAHPVHSRRLVGGAGRLGPTVTVAAGSWLRFPDFGPGLPADLSTSGIRTLSARAAGGLLATHGSVLLSDGTRTRVVSSGTDGDLVLSGTRLVWATPSGALLLHDLATGVTTSLTVRHGLREAPARRSLAGTLDGRYLAYAAGGWAWRLDLETGRAARLGRTDARPGVGTVLTAGNVVAWPEHGGVQFRDARTGGAVTTLPGRQLDTISPAGVVVQGADGVVFHTWGGTTRPLPGTTARVDGGFVAFLGTDGRPRVAPLATGRARPQVLGRPLAAARVRAGAGWSFDQPTSEPLAACAVVVRTAAGRVAARLACARPAAAQGEVLAHWDGRTGGRVAAPGRYSWQLTARNGSGGLLDTTGAAAAVTGRLLVTR